MAVENTNRTEEIQDIIDKIPTHFATVVTGLVVIIFSILLAACYFIRYPDIVSGQISINSSSAPLKLVAPMSGRLMLNGLRSQDSVRKDQVLAWLESPAVTKDLISLKNLLDSISPPFQEPARLFGSFPRDLSLGEVNGEYFAFLNALRQGADYEKNRMYDKQIASFQNLLFEQENVLKVVQAKLMIGARNLKLVSIAHDRDSLLHRSKVLSSAEYEKSGINFGIAQEQYQSSVQNIAVAHEAISKTRSQLQEASIAKSVFEKELSLTLLNAYNSLLDKVRSWDQRFVFRSPFAGKVQFLRFWTEMQFVSSGEPVFTIVPPKDSVVGQVILPARGAGKVKVGQRVIVKLDDYPYQEFGSINGSVKNISMTTNVVQSGQEMLETYLVQIAFDKGLVTNYGNPLDFRYEIKGSADIVTKDRRLASRLLDNVLYTLKEGR